MIADTSFLIASFIEEDELHDKAKQLIGENEEIIVIDRILEETFTVLSYKKGGEYALEIINRLMNSKDVNIYKLTEEDSASIIKLAGSIKRKISFCDYSIIYISMKNNEKVLCFDEELNRVIKYERQSKKV